MAELGNHGWTPELEKAHNIKDSFDNLPENEQTKDKKDELIHAIEEAEKASQINEILPGTVQLLRYEMDRALAKVGKKVEEMVRTTFSTTFLSATGLFKTGPDKKSDDEPKPPSPGPGTGTPRSGS